MEKAMLGCGGLLCSHHCSLLLSSYLLVSGQSIFPCRGCRAGAVQRPGGAGLTRLSIVRGRKVLSLFCAHILQPGAAWDAPAWLLWPWVLQQHCSEEG